jgi:prophage tail gpP-like protein
MANARKNNGASGRGRNKRESLPNYWLRGAPSITYGEERFRVRCVRGEKKKSADRNVSLDDFVTSVSWEDSSPILRGSISLQTIEGKKPLAIYEGHKILLDVAPRQGGEYRRIWEMRILSSTITASSGEHVFDLADELAWLQKSRDDWQFKERKNKKQSDTHTYRPKGWRADQIVREVCRRYGVKVGKLAKGTKYISNLTEQNASPLEIIMKAYKLERNFSGRKFVVRMRGGELQVVPVRYSKTMLLLGGSLLDATISRSLRKSLATAAHVRATVKGSPKEPKAKEKGKSKSKNKGSKQNKLEVDVVAKKAVARYGFVHTTLRLDDAVSSKAEARKEAKAELVKSMRPNRQVTFDHPGISTLFRGDAVKLQLPELGLREIAYVTGVSHSVSSGEYTMSVTVKFADPVKDEKGEEIRKKQCEKARKHGREAPSFCSDDDGRPKPKKADQRGDGGTAVPRGS